MSDLIFIGGLQVPGASLFKVKLYTYLLSRKKEVKKIYGGSGKPLHWKFNMMKNYLEEKQISSAKDVGTISFQDRKLLLVAAAIRASEGFKE